MWKYFTVSQVSALCSIICHHIVYEGKRESIGKSVTQLIYFNDNERHHQHQQQFYFIFLSQPTPKKKMSINLFIIFHNNIKRCSFIR